VFQKHSSIETSMSSAFFCLKYATCLWQQHFPCFYWTIFVYDFVKVKFLCFTPFCAHQSYSRSHNLFWLVEAAGMYEVISVSLLIDRSQHATTAIVSIRGGSSRRAAGLQPSLKNVRQKIPPNGQTRLKFKFSYENFATQSFSVLPTPFRLNVS